LRGLVMVDIEALLPGRLAGVPVTLTLSHSPNAWRASR
jgi:hypothetical protein